MREYRWKILLLSAVVFMAAALSHCNCNNGVKHCETPIVEAGEDIQATVGDTVVLICDVRLPPEDLPVCQSEIVAVYVEWEQMSGPAAVLEGADQAQASFVPTEEGAYKFCCTATYPVTELNQAPLVSQPDCVNVNVADVVCDPPVADAGADQILASRASDLPATATLDGSRSSAAGGPGCGRSITRYTWSVVEKPGTMSPTIADPDQAVTTVELPEFGDYLFQLEVQDDGGTEGRADTDTDSIAVSLQETGVCEGDLAVTVVSAASGAGMSGIEMVVVDAGGSSHTRTTDASGAAAFTGLAAGNRRSITAKSTETVPALPGAGGGQRPRFETTTVLDHCSDRITVPLHFTASGHAAIPRAAVKAKVPAAVFDTLPSLLPFFGLGSSDISGQMRVAIMVPVLPVDSFSAFPVERLFARPPTDEALLPGNLATDDTFLNGLADALGIDPWGAECVRNADCPTPENPDVENYGCEDNDVGERRCKDKNPMRNLKMDLPVGQEVPVAVLLGIMNISLADLLPTLMPFLTDPDGSGTMSFDVGSMLGAFKLQTIAVCLLKVKVEEGQVNDITEDLKALTADDCWSIEYTTQEVVDAIRDEGAIVPSNECLTNADCGWPDSGKKCRPDPLNLQKKYCLVPMFRIKIISSDAVSVHPDQTGFDPFAMKADARLCENLPPTAQHEIKCLGSGGVPTTCDGGPQYCDVILNPQQVECAYAYGVGLLALDFPKGHAELLDGGRVVIGFDFNRTPLTEVTGLRFFVPDPQRIGATVSAAQRLVRYVTTMPDGSYATMTGNLGASASSENPPGFLELPPLLPPPDPGQLPDAGFEVKIGLVPDDPLADCQTVIFEKIYAVATAMREPTSAHLLPAAPGETALAGSGFKGLRLGLTVRNPVEEAAYVDPLWRIYAPATTTTFELPASANPFSAGQEVWLQFWGGGFTLPFDYDLLPTGMILQGVEIYTDDTWALKKE